MASDMPRKGILRLTQFICLLIILQSGLLLFLAPRIKPRDTSPKYIHLSIDDASCILDLIENQTKYTSIFDQPFLSYIKNLHEKFNLKISLYTFSEIENVKESGKNIYITNLPERFLNEFIENNSWLRVGFHWKGMDFDKGISSENYQVAYNNVFSSFYHNPDSSAWTSTLRLHYFFAPDSLLSKMNHISTLLCADSKDRDSYNLSKPELEYLNHHRYFNKNGIQYIPTDIRIENHIFLERELQKNIDRDTLVVFTHEWALTNQTIRNIFSRLIHDKQLMVNSINRHNLETALRVCLDLNEFNH